MILEVPRASDGAANLTVTAEGHVPKVTGWRPPGGFPRTYTMKLERGSSIAGVVVDEELQPVPGVRIGFQGPGIDLAKTENVQFGPDTDAQTDTAGRWSCTTVPRTLDELFLVLAHPDFAVTRTNVAVNKAESTNLVLTIRRGVTVSGWVTDVRNRPIGGASVREVRLFAGPNRSTQSEVLGWFALEHLNPGELNPGELTLVVQAQGYAPEVLTTNVSAGPLEVRFQLEPGQVLRGRVVDELGKPIPNALAKTDWDNRGLRYFEWSARTDHEGRFIWDSAPVGAILYSIEAEGYKAVGEVQLEADNSEHEITLRACHL